MKRFIYLLFLILGVTFTSCKKEDIQPTQPAIEIAPSVELSGKWLLVGGEMYVSNLTTDSDSVYSHFGPNKTVSSLRFMESPNFDIESIEINQTTWSFYDPQNVGGFGEFVLNDNNSNPYAIEFSFAGGQVTPKAIIPNPNNTSGNQLSRMVLMGFEAYDVANNVWVFYVYNATTSHNGCNYEYFSALKFKKIQSW